MNSLQRVGRSNSCRRNFIISSVHWSGIFPPRFVEKIPHRHDRRDYSLSKLLVIPLLKVIKPNLSSLYSFIIIGMDFFFVALRLEWNCSSPLFSLEWVFIAPAVIVYYRSRTRYAIHKIDPRGATPDSELCISQRRPKSVRKPLMSLYILYYNYHV